MTITSLCLFAGARSGGDPAVADLAAGLGVLVAARGVTLVCDAGSHGLTGVAARAALTGGGRVVGIGIGGDSLVAADTGPGLTEPVVTASHNDRKTAMFARSDAVVVLPGGIGTMAELFAVMTWRGLGLHARPIFLLGGVFWQPLRDLLGHLDRAGFADPGLFALIEPLAGLDALAARLDE